MNDEFKASQGRIVIGMNGQDTNSLAFNYEEYVHASQHLKNLRTSEDLYHVDEYEWEREEREREEDLVENTKNILSKSNFKENMLGLLTDVEKRIVCMRVFENLAFYSIARQFPQYDREGNIRLDDEGNVKLHDHKWAQRRYNEAINKMREGVSKITLEDRIKTPLQFKTSGNNEIMKRTYK